MTPTQLTAVRDAMLEGLSRAKEICVINQEYPAAAACRDAIHELRHLATEAEVGRARVEGGGSMWYYIVRDGMGGYEYLWRDGTWHKGNCDQGYWPTESAALAFLRGGGDVNGLLL